jgi:hypothetical protein
MGLQSSLSLQVFKINSNMQGVFKLVDQPIPDDQGFCLSADEFVGTAYSFTHSCPVALTPRVANTDMISPNQHEPWQSGVLRI